MSAVNSLRLFSLVGLCACAALVPPTLSPETLELHTEPGVTVRASVQVTNAHPRRDMVVYDLSLLPSDQNLAWIGDGEWTLAPDESRTLTVSWTPSELIQTTGAVVLQTTEGTVELGLTLTSEVGIDEDNDGYSVIMGDCDDRDPTSYPEAPELCDGRDNNCDERVDEDFDGDGDGYAGADECPEEWRVDCNDRDYTANPGAEEECDLSDSDCNGVVDDITTLSDKQQGVCEGSLKRCTAGGPVEPIYSYIELYETTELSCDGVDNDCDGGIDDFDRLADGTPDCVDDDGDGEREVDGDCDDLDKEITSKDCGPITLVVTSNQDGFALIDLNTVGVKTVRLGEPTYTGDAVSATSLWFTSRNRGLLLHHNLETSDTLTSASLGVQVWGVKASPEPGEILVILGRLLQRRDAENGGLIKSFDLGVVGTAAAWGPAGGLWVTTAQGLLWEVDPVLGPQHSWGLGVASYGAPAIEPGGRRMFIAAYDDNQLVEFDRLAGKVVEVHEAVEPPVRVAWVAGEVWATSGVNRTVDAYSADTVERRWTAELADQTQGIWYDASRDLVWVAVFGDNEVLAIDRSTGSVIGRASVQQPIDLFPLPR